MTQCDSQSVCNITQCPLLTHHPLTKMTIEAKILEREIISPTADGNKKRRPEFKYSQCAPAGLTGLIPAELACSTKFVPLDTCTANAAAAAANFGPAGSNKRKSEHGSEVCRDVNVRKNWNRFRVNDASDLVKVCPRIQNWLALHRTYDERT